MATNTTLDSDPFCEQRFWRARGVDPIVAEPVSATTGIIMVVFAFIPNIVVAGQGKTHTHPRISTLFYLCKAALIIVGIGTTFFHGLSDADARAWHVSDSMFDWVPIVVMTSAVMTLYLSNLMNMGELGGTLVFAGLCSWSATLIVMMDSTSKTHFSQENGQSGGQDTYGTILNVLLLLPLGVMLLYTGVAKFPSHKDIHYLWAGLAVNVILWVVNAYACSTTLELFVFHSIYHVLIAHVFIFATCLGVCLDDANWEFRGLHHFWPEIAPKEPKLAVMKIQPIR